MQNILNGTGKQEFPMSGDQFQNQHQFGVPQRSNGTNPLYYNQQSIYQMNFAPYGRQGENTGTSQVGTIPVTNSHSNVSGIPGILNGTQSLINGVPGGGNLPNIYNTQNSQIAPNKQGQLITGMAPPAVIADYQSKGLFGTAGKGSLNGTISDTQQKSTLIGGQRNITDNIFGQTMMDMNNSMQVVIGHQQPQQNIGNFASINLGGNNESNSNSPQNIFTSTASQQGSLARTRSHTRTSSGTSLSSTSNINKKSSTTPDISSGSMNGSNALNFPYNSSNNQIVSNVPNRSASADSISASLLNDQRPYQIPQPPRLFKNVLDDNGIMNNSQSKLVQRQQQIGQSSNNMTQIFNDRVLGSSMNLSLDQGFIIGQPQQQQQQAQYFYSNYRNNGSGLVDVYPQYDNIGIFQQRPISMQQQLGEQNLSFSQALQLQPSQKQNDRQFFTGYPPTQVFSGAQQQQLQPQIQRQNFAATSGPDLIQYSPEKRAGFAMSMTNGPAIPANLNGGVGDRNQTPNTQSIIGNTVNSENSSPEIMKNNNNIINTNNKISTSLSYNSLSASSSLSSNNNNTSTNILGTRTAQPQQYLSGTGDVVSTLYNTAVTEDPEINNNRSNNLIGASNSPPSNIPMTSILNKVPSTQGFGSSASRLKKNSNSSITNTIADSQLLLQQFQMQLQQQQQLGGNGKDSSEITDSIRNLGSLPPTGTGNISVSNTNQLKSIDGVIDTPHNIGQHIQQQAPVKQANVQELFSMFLKYYSTVQEKIAKKRNDEIAFYGAGKYFKRDAEYETDKIALLQKHRADKGIINRRLNTNIVNPINASVSDQDISNVVATTNGATSINSDQQQIARTTGSLSSGNQYICTEAIYRKIIESYFDKRKQRDFSKKVAYQSRHDTAVKRERIKGRFVSKSELQDAQQQSSTDDNTNNNMTNLEGRNTDNEEPMPLFIDTGDTEYTKMMDPAALRQEPIENLVTMASNIGLFKNVSNEEQKEEFKQTSLSFSNTPLSSKKQQVEAETLSSNSESNTMNEIEQKKSLMLNSIFESNLKNIIEGENNCQEASNIEPSEQSMTNTNNQGSASMHNRSDLEDCCQCCKGTTDIPTKKRKGKRSKRLKTDNMLLEEMEKEFTEEEKLVYQNADIIKEALVLSISQFTKSCSTMSLSLNLSQNSSSTVNSPSNNISFAQFANFKGSAKKSTANNNPTNDLFGGDENMNFYGNNVNTNNNKNSSVNISGLVQDDNGLGTRNTSINIFENLPDNTFSTLINLKPVNDCQGNCSDGLQNAENGKDLSGIGSSNLSSIHSESSESDMINHIDV